MKNKKQTIIDLKKNTRASSSSRVLKPSRNPGSGANSTSSGNARGRVSGQRKPLRPAFKSRGSFSKKKKPNYPALFIALFLILSITGFFVYKTQLQKRSDLTALLKNQKSESVTLNEEVKLSSPRDVLLAINNEDYQLIDVREEGEFKLVHIESSDNLPFSKIEAVLPLIKKNKKVIVIDQETLPRSIILANHLHTEGVEVGYLEGGILAYAKEGYKVINLPDPGSARDKLKTVPYSVNKAIEEIKKGERLKLVDVRSVESFNKKHIPNAVNIPLVELEERKSELPIGKILLISDNPIEAFSAASLLYDMNITLNVYFLNDSYLNFAQELANERKKIDESKEVGEDNDHTESAENKEN